MRVNPRSFRSATPLQPLLCPCLPLEWGAAASVVVLWKTNHLSLHRQNQALLRPHKVVSQVRCIAPERPVSDCPSTSKLTKTAWFSALRIDFRPRRLSWFSPAIILSHAHLTGAVHSASDQSQGVGSAVLSHWFASRDVERQPGAKWFWSGAHLQLPSAPFEDAHGQRDVFRSPCKSSRKCQPL